MDSLAEKAINNHKSFYSCSASILCAFAEEIGMSDQAARTVAGPFAGGKMGKYGAVLAAEYVLAKKSAKTVPILLNLKDCSQIRTNFSCAVNFAAQNVHAVAVCPMRQNCLKLC